MKITLISVDETIAMLGVRDISAILKQAGHEVKLFSMQGFTAKRYYNARQLEILEEYIKGDQLIGVSSMAINRQKSLQILELARKLGIMTIWGGIYPTLFPAESCQYADYVCVGEGDGAILDFVNHFENSQPLEQIKNIAYLDKHTGQCVVNPLRPLLRDLDSQPLPDHDLDNQQILIDEDLYSIAEYLLNPEHQSGRSLYIYAYSSRGCPYSCTFCSNSKLNDMHRNEKSRIRNKSIDRVIKELTVLKEIYWNFKKVWIVDDSFLTRDETVLQEFKEKYIKHINLPLDFFAAPNMLKYSKMETLLPIDVSLIRVGVQSGSPHTLKEVYNRPIRNKYVTEASRVLYDINKKHNTTINAVYQFIINNPYEEARDLIETIKLIRRIKPPFYISIFFLTFFPGSKLYERAVADGIIRQENDRSDQEFLADNFKNHLTVKTKNLYLSSVLFWMHGEASKHFIGCIPRILVRFLISGPMIFIHNRLKPLVMIYNKIAHKLQKPLSEFLNSFLKNNHKTN
jgi:radical SAM superfamily enzyme YgiQ (UPF0313 family)